MTVRRIGVLSDLHLERSPYPHPLPPADVYVFAGDIDVKGRGVEWIRAQTGDVPAIYVPGNHEPYGEKLPRMTEELKAAAEGTNVHVLDQDSVILSGVRFLGATLWTDFALHGSKPADVNVAMATAGDKEWGMTDYRRITLNAGGQYRKLIPKNTALMHAVSVRWLREQLAVPFKGPTIVVTHHAPSNAGNRPRERSDKYAPCYASNLDDLVAESGVPFWIHGHTHYVHDTLIGETHLVSNPRGYEDLYLADPLKNADHYTGYDPEYVIEVSIPGAEAAAA